MTLVFLKGVKIVSKDILEFDYVDAKGKHSHRVIWPIVAPGDKYFGIDLTEFDEPERKFLTTALNDIYTVYLEEIKQLGLGSNYRYFKEGGISGFTKQTN